MRPQHVTQAVHGSLLFGLGQLLKQAPHDGLLSQEFEGGVDRLARFVESAHFFGADVCPTWPTTRL